MIEFISKENKESSEAQFVPFSGMSIQEKPLFWITSEEQTFKKVKQEVLHNKLVQHFSLKKNWFKKCQNANNS